MQVGAPGIPQAYHTNDKNVQPRLGFAWDPFHQGKTIVRAAYAILNDQPVTNAVSVLSGNPPFALPVTVSSTYERPQVYKYRFFYRCKRRAQYHQSEL